MKQGMNQVRPWIGAESGTRTRMGIWQGLACRPSHWQWDAYTISAISAI